MSKKNKILVSLMLVMSGFLMAACSKPNFNNSFYLSTYANVEVPAANLAAFLMIKLKKHEFQEGKI